MTLKNLINSHNPPLCRHTSGAARPQSEHMQQQKASAERTSVTEGQESSGIREDANLLSALNHKSVVP